MLKIVISKLPGNGSCVISVDIELRDIIIGDAEYFMYTLEIKYAESETTAVNMRPKKMLKL